MNRLLPAAIAALATLAVLGGPVSADSGEAVPDAANFSKALEPYSQSDSVTVMVITAYYSFRVAPSSSALPDIACTHTSKAPAALADLLKILRNAVTDYEPGVKVTAAREGHYYAPRVGILFDKGSETQGRLYTTDGDGVNAVSGDLNGDLLQASPDLAETLRAWGRRDDVTWVDNGNIPCSAKDK